MAVPKSKISNSRRGMRRSHIKLNTKNLIEDKDSGEIRLSHHVDMTTGMYRSLGAFRRVEFNDKVKNKEFGIMSRAGFSYGICKKLLVDMKKEEIEDIYER